MPARKIPKNYRNITGKVVLTHAQSSVVGFESSLERDFILLKDFDEAVLNIEEQPITLEYVSNEKVCKYTPDFLVTYTDKKAELVEIKYSDDLKTEKLKHPNKFAAAESFAANNGWAFSFYTEHEIHSNRLKNITFLRQFIGNGSHYPYSEIVKSIVTKSRSPLRVCDILELAFRDKYQQAQLLSTVWHLIANREVHADLDTPITNETLVEELYCE